MVVLGGGAVSHERGIPVAAIVHPQGGLALPQSGSFSQVDTDVRGVSDTLQPSPHTPHPAPYSLRPTSYTLHPASHTLHHTPYTNDH